jgi:16S rRNA (guanine966-N2)-methyltransferase
VLGGCARIARCGAGDPVSRTDAGRVIAGSAQGVRLLAPGEGTRPLADRAKQALFGILEAGTLRPWPTPFLDLFAGSGAAGIEALSRGAPECTFVERAPPVVRAIAENLRRAGLEGAGIEVVRSDVLRWLDAAGPPAVAFGAVLVDPPYGDPALLAALERLGDPGSRWLATPAVVVAKHFWRDTLPARVGTLERARERRFGETLLTFFVTGGIPVADELETEDEA